MTLASMSVMGTKKTIIIATCKVLPAIVLLTELDIEYHWTFYRMQSKVEIL